MARLQTPLDKHHDIARKVVAEGIARGKSWKEIADELSEMLGEKITEAMVRYFYYKEFEMEKESDEAVVNAYSAPHIDSEEFDLEKELAWLYRVQKKRIQKLLSLEEQAGIPFPDVNKQIDIAARVLEKIAMIRLKFGGETPEDLIQRLLEAVEEKEEEK